MTDERKDSQTENQAQSTHEAAVLIARHQQEVLNLWVDAVVEVIPSARDQARAEVGDHLQNLLDDIVRALESVGDGEFSLDAPPLEEFGEPSRLHGRERASMQGYSVDQVVHEYMVLRYTLTGFCSAHGLKDRRSADIIAYVIEYASLAAVKEFVRSVLDIQRKTVSTLIHDVRTPLSVAMNYGELLTVATVSEEQKQRALETISKSLKRVSAMLEDLLDTVTLEAGHGLVMRFHEGDLKTALEAVCKEADLLYGEKTIKAELPSHPVVGVFDTALIVRSVENLISNAVKFGNKNTPVEVCLDEDENQVTIRVHNHGNPIAKTNLEDIFSFFSTSESSRGASRGWGLGLSLIKTVAKHHGGEVILDSSSEDGTTFGIILEKRHQESGSELSVLI